MSTNPTSPRLRSSRSSVRHAPTSVHDKNFQKYLIQYAESNQLTMSGSVWQSAEAAAKRLDYTKDRHAAPNMTLSLQIAPREGIFTRLFGRFLRRTTTPAYLSELDDIRAFLNSAPKAAAQQSEIKWGPLVQGFGSRMIARLLPGGEQKGSHPTPAKYLLNNSG
ncbi:MAG: hypothetical protein ACPGWR_10850 [Ardenticatenaceae bacterium]